MPSRRGAFPGRSAAAFALGAAAGVVASRLLPPVAAMAAGSARAAAGRDPFEALAADHRRFVALLTNMEESRDEEIFRRTQLLLRLKRRLAAHALAEEDVVYPLLHDEAKAEHDAKHLYGEHAEVKMLLYRLEQLPKDDSGWTQNVRALKALVSQHARHEEETDFPRLREALDERAMRRLSRGLHREKALVL